MPKVVPHNTKVGCAIGSRVRNKPAHASGVAKTAHVSVVTFRFDRIRLGPCGVFVGEVEQGPRIYQASNSSPEVCERKVTGAGSSLEAPKHWMDSGPD